METSLYAVYFNNVLDGRRTRGIGRCWCIWSCCCCRCCCCCCCCWIDTTGACCCSACRCCSLASSIAWTFAQKYKTMPTTSKWQPIWIHLPWLAAALLWYISVAVYMRRVRVLSCKWCLREMCVFARMTEWVFVFSHSLPLNCGRCWCPTPLLHMSVSVCVSITPATPPTIEWTNKNQAFFPSCFIYRRWHWSLSFLSFSYDNSTAGIFFFYLYLNVCGRLLAAYEVNQNILVWHLMLEPLTVVDVK